MPLGRASRLEGARVISARLPIFSVPPREDSMSTAIDPLAARVRITQLLDEFSSRVDRGESVADLMEEQSRFVAPVWAAEGRTEIAAKLLSLAESRNEKGLVAPISPPP